MPEPPMAFLPDPKLPGIVVVVDAGVVEDTNGTVGVVLEAVANVVDTAIIGTVVTTTTERGAETFSHTVPSRSLSNLMYFL
jgi:hypothetical protein